MASTTAHAALAPLRQLYLKNLAALYGSDPLLAAQLEQVPFAQLPPLEPTRDGEFTTRVQTDDGKPVYTHSRYNPLEEARTLISTQVERALADRAARRTAQDARDGVAAEALGRDEAGLEGQCFLISGVGLGYHIAEIERRYYRPLLIVAEADLALIKAALCVSDLAEPLRERRVTFITAPDKSAVHQRLHGAITTVLLGLTFVVPPYTTRVRASFHRQISALLRDFISYSRIQVVSLLRLSRATARNVALNLPTYVANPGVEVLHERAAGYPAIIVAAGPSLARNVGQLQELRQRAVVIAVQTVFKMLLARRIPPHFVCSLDYHEVSAQFFHGLTDLGGAALVAEPKAHWQVLDAFRGRRHVLYSDFAANLLREVAPARGALRAGSTVAHLAFYLAEYLGCNPIILIGQDLSYSEGLYYPAGTQIERIWQPELGRFNTVEMKQWERIVRVRNPLLKVRDIYGRETYTEEALYTYAEQFQADFLQSRARIIHATEGGLRLQGTEVMTLRQAAEQFCTRPLPPDLLNPQSAPVDTTLRQRVSTAVAARIAEVREIRSIAGETVELLAQLAALVDRPKEFNRLITRVDELRTRMGRNERTFELVAQVSQYAEFRRVQADRAIRDGEAETPESIRRRLRRDREYATALIDGCDYLLQFLPQALQRVQEQLP
jgi:hypothetical protein